LETVMLSSAVSDERAHAPNEFFRLASFDDGLKAWARVLPELAAARP
jgi:acetylornithine deacetylase/succinyl-diaminopimelate desuccinylase-like protein